MELCVSTFINYRATLLETLPVFARHKIRNLEIWAVFTYGNEFHFPYWEKDYPDLLRTALEKYGISARLIHAPFSESLDISSLDETVRQETVQEIRRAIDAFSRLPETETVIVHPGGMLREPEEEPERLRQSRKSVLELALFLEERQLRLAVENMPAGLVGTTPANLLTLIDGVSNAGICLDTGHAFISEALTDFLDTAWDKIITFHISDTCDRKDRHLMPFAGKIDWNLFRQKIDDGKTPELLTFEIRARGNLNQELKQIKSIFDKLNEGG